MGRCRIGTGVQFEFLLSCISTLSMEGASYRYSVSLVAPVLLYLGKLAYPNAERVNICTSA